MPSKKEAPEGKTPKHKEERIEIRADTDLARRAREKASKHGWTISSVLRALLELWTDDDVISPEDVGRHASRARRKTDKD